MKLCTLYLCSSQYFTHCYVHSLHLHCALLYGKCSSGRFSCKKTNLLTFSVDNTHRLAVIILPEVHALKLLTLQQYQDTFEQW